MKINESICVQDMPSCLLCGGEGLLLYQDLRDRLFEAPGIWALRQYSECGLIWLDPHPLPTEIGKLYQSYYTHADCSSVPNLGGVPNTIGNAILSARLGYKGLASGPLQKWLGTILSWVGPIREMVEVGVMTLEGPPKGKLLEVGCGNGQFLAQMREFGWEVVGVEPDPQAVKIAREHFGLSVYEGILQKADFPEDSFDTITMNHVIEHLLDPIATLQGCRRVLKPGGRLVVVTPNMESLGHRVFRELYLHLDPPRHLHLFSLNSLQTCAERTGLQVVTTLTAARSARQAWARSWLIRRKGRSPLTAEKGFWLRAGGLVFQAVGYGLCGIRNVGEELLLIATK